MLCTVFPDKVKGRRVSEMVQRETHEGPAARLGDRYRQGVGILDEAVQLLFNNGRKIAVSRINYGRYCVVGAPASESIAALVKVYLHT